jgi:hypothetical protein
VFGGNGVKCCAQFSSFILREDSRGYESRRVSFAGGHFVGKKTPVKNDGALPLFEIGIQWLAKAARPHLYGL